jgi:large subunit ribosomal protein L4
MIERLAAWEADGRVLLVLAARDEVVEKSAANLRQVRIILAGSLNVVDVLEADTIVFTRAALARAEEVFA